MQDLPYSLMAELDKVNVDGHPPVHLWHPEVEKNINLVIERNGTWQYEGTPIKRPRLVRLFASVLRREGDEYFLVTPVEKCRITVEDTPFQVVLMDNEGEGKSQVIQMTTDTGDSFPVDANHPLRITQQGEEWIPYVLARDGMEARVTRNVYYQLAELLVTGDDHQWLGLWSSGTFFPLMQAE